MNLLKKCLYISLAIVLFGLKMNAQSVAEKPGIGKGNLYSQFNYIIYQSDKQEDYRVVKGWWLYNIRNQVKDSITQLQDSIIYFQQTLNNSVQKIDSLTNVLAKTNQSLTNVTDQKNSILLFGISIDKNVYKSIIWSLIVVLAILLIVFILLFKRSNVVTVRSKNDLSEVREEFEAFRKKALVREQQLVRNMYDEVLKYKNKIKQ